jgi:peptidoglycan glycosyltransferase
MALGEDTVGAVVALDPQSGAVLAMVSTPSYNPNRLASHDFEGVQAYFASSERRPREAQPGPHPARRLRPRVDVQAGDRAAALEQLDLDADSNVPPAHRSRSPTAATTS